MDYVEQALAEFNARSNSSAPSRIDALQDIEEHSDPRVLLFLLQVAMNIDELPEVRAHVIKVLRSRHLASDERTSVAHAIARILADGTSPGLRVQSALALADFSDVEGVIHVLGTVALDDSEPIDLRYSAFTSLEQAGRRSECVDILRQLSVDEIFSRLATRLLSRGDVQ